MTLSQPTIVPTLVCDPFFGFCFPANVGVDQVVAPDSSYKGAFNAGGGLDLRLGQRRLKLFAEACYHRRFTAHGSDMSYVPVTFGARG